MAVTVFLNLVSFILTKTTYFHQAFQFNFGYKILSAAKQSQIFPEVICQDSDYVFSDGRNHFSQFGLFHTIQKRHFSIRHSNLPLAVRSWVQQNSPRFSPGVISSALSPYLVYSRSVCSRLEKFC